MNDEYNSVYTLSPLHHPNKNVIFKGKKYLVDFELLKQNSNYFYEHSADYQNNKDIEISSDISVINDEIVQQFLSSCQNEPFTVKMSNIIGLHHLSCEYDVPNLKNITYKFIDDHCHSLILKIIKFKHSLSIKEKTYSLPLIQEEDIVRQCFFEYIKEDEFYDIPIEFIYRVINEKDFEIKNEEEEIYTEFLFKCLDKYQKEASILFLNVRLKNKETRHKLFKRLIKEYSSIIDFHLINPKFLIETILDAFEENSQLKALNRQLNEEAQEMKNTNDQQPTISCLNIHLNKAFDLHDPMGDENEIYVIFYLKSEGKDKAIKSKTINGPNPVWD